MRNKRSLAYRKSALKRCAAMRAAKERKRMQNPPEGEPIRVPEGQFLESLTWHASSGDVKKLVIRQGSRANNIKIDGMKKSHGWDYVMRKLRSKLSVKKMIFE